MREPVGNQRSPGGVQRGKSWIQDTGFGTQISNRNSPQKTRVRGFGIDAVRIFFYRWALFGFGWRDRNRFWRFGCDKDDKFRPTVERDPLLRRG